ncbi:MAG: sigma 54-interacting transcriptional regulator [Desulfovibrio sp.]|jgi:PAS domain S-box-containing protein|nr:sigma 54-interacting transcriptional regulator [Desulfovibrio sp.]
MANRKNGRTGHLGNRMPGSLEDESGYLNAVLESSYDGIYITDGNADTIKVNSSYETISGLRRSEVLGGNMRDLVASGIISASGTLLVLEKRKSVTLEQSFNTGRQAVITSTPKFDERGNIVMVVTNVRNISDIYNLRHELNGEKERIRQRLSEIAVLREQIIGGGDITAVDDVMLEVLLLARKVARQDTTVLLLGETGVGKGLLAAYIHRNSPRRQGKLITVNCSAIPDNLVESELFGYVEGSFTGAKKGGKPGLAELADKGTLFLDEVGDLPISVQGKLLRLLQEHEAHPVGASAPRKLDVRVIAATNLDIGKLSQNTAFRSDLYYRLSAFPLRIPALRERPGDIAPLAETFLAEFNRKYRLRKKFSQFAVMALQRYNWPGNVRELRNVVERAIVLSTGDCIQQQDLALMPDNPLDPECRFRPGPKNAVDLKEILMRVEREYIRQAYAVHGNIRRAAAGLRMDPATFLRRKKKYDAS